MNFKISDEDTALVKHYRRFAKENIDWREYRKKEFPWALYEKFKAQGLTGALIPEEYGGMGLTMFTFILLTEVLFYADAGATLSLASQPLGAVPIMLFGNEEQKRKYLPEIALGAIVAYAQTEPNAGSDVAGIETRGTDEGDEIILNGRKHFITNGSVAKYLIVIVRTDPPNPPEKRYRGLSMVIVDAEKARREGTLHFGEDFDKGGIHCSPTSQFSFENCRIPKENILGIRGGGFKHAMAALTLSRVTIADQGLAIAEAAFDETVSYVMERKQFGEPLAKFQGVHMSVAEMARKVEAARLLVYKAAWLIDEHGMLGVPLFIKDASIAKRAAGEAAEFTTSRGAKLHGGYGFMKDSRIQALKEDAGVVGTYEGTDEIQDIIIAREIFGEFGMKI